MSKWLFWIFIKNALQQYDTVNNVIKMVCVKNEKTKNDNKINVILFNDIRYLVFASQPMASNVQRANRTTLRQTHAPNSQSIHTINRRTMQLPFRLCWQIKYSSNFSHTKTKEPVRLTQLMKCLCFNAGQFSNILPARCLALAILPTARIIQENSETNIMTITSIHMTVH